MKVRLRDYQEEALRAISEASARGKRRVLVALPTGTGKTVVFSSLIKKRGGTALILAHRDELLQQAADKLTSVAPELGMSIGIVRAERNDTHAPVVIASIQTLARQKRLEQLANRFDTVVVDEAHHATAASYRRVLDHVDAGLVAGFTATPERSDKDKLTDVFEELVYARSILEMIEQGYLVDLRALRVEIEGLDLRKVKVSRGDYQAKDLGRAMSEVGAAQHTAAALTEHAAERKSVVFVPTVELAHETAAAISAAGIPAAALDGSTPREERASILARLSAGELRAVVNVGVLTEGFDEPSVDCVAIAAPTRSRVRYVQMVGRGTRLYPGKEDCLVLDLAGVSDDLKLQSLPRLFDLSAPPREGERISRAVARERAERAAREAEEAKLREAAGERRTRTARLWARDRLRWHQIDGRWVLSLGRSDLLVLWPQDERNWQVLLVRPRAYRVLASGFDLGYAQGAAEQAVRDAEARTLVDRQASWRRGEPTEGQRRYLAMLGVTAEPKTKGEAADLITEAVARKRLVRLERALTQRQEQQEAQAA